MKLEKFKSKLSTSELIQENQLRSLSGGEPRSYSTTWTNVGDGKTGTDSQIGSATVFSDGAKSTEDSQRNYCC
jgi:hypothetical protein